MNYQQPLEQLFSRYEATWLKDKDLMHSSWNTHQIETLQRMRSFLASHHDVFKREHLVGHFTGSALVTSPDLNEVLLTLHAKLGKWLQLGGHADGEIYVEQVAKREAEEEGGLSDLVPYFYTAYPGLWLPFDLDIHDISARGKEPEHQHFDVRFITIAAGNRTPKKSSESKDLRWVKLAEAKSLTQEPSMLRQFAKLERLRDLRA